MAKNPTWQPDEIILALELLLKHGKPLHNNHPDVIELSNTLRSMQVVLHRPDPLKFRNTNGVAYKLQNLARFMGKSSMGNGGKGEEEIWNKYGNDVNSLREKADLIRFGISELENQSNVDGRDYDVDEGGIVERLHKAYERDASIIKKKKEQVFKLTGKLACECCGFDFREKYGTIGDGFIECHHNNQLALRKEKSKTSLADLSLVCSNCHRMLHRKGLITLEELRRQMYGDK